MILKSHRRRVAGIAFCVFASLFLLTFRLFQLQVRKKGHITGPGPHTRKIYRPRGTIFDRNGNRLAFSLLASSLFADPSLIKNPHETALALSGILQMDARMLESKLSERGRFVWIARKLEHSIAQRIRNLRIRGLGFRTEDKRYYPNGSLCANVLGFVGLDSKGLEGIEYEHDTTLASREGEKLVLSGFSGLEIPKANVIIKAPMGGDNLYLTIDEVIQHLCEREAQSLFERWQAKSCFILVMAPHSGEVLACAVRPTFDPNRFSGYPDWSYKNRAVSDIYEPGSVFKIVTAAAALEDHRIQPAMTFDCPGFIKLYGISIRCTGVHGSLTLRQTIEKSCNACIAKVGRLLGPESFYYYIRKFGFGEKSGVDVPGEVEGLLRLPRKWSGLSCAAISMGQEIGVTGIQMVSAVSVIANGGKLVRPHFIRRVVSADGKRVIRENSCELRRRVVSQHVTDELASMMEQVVVKGTGRKGSLDRYTAAGKTGTSQKLGAGAHGKHVVSFAGFVPVHNPAVTIYVVVNEPQGRRVSGGGVAAPAFKELAGEIMLYMGIPPDKVAENRPRPQKEQVFSAPSPPAIRARVDSIEVPGDDPVGAVVDAALAPLPGAGGIGGIESSSANDGVGRLIDAQMRRNVLLSTSGSAAIGQDGGQGQRR